ncbi:MAG: late competence development ComFB family protein [Spirochaetales bacterium]|nr:late competence development ComFB family protein [Spirochaetales bacterium]
MQIHNVMEDIVKEKVNEVFQDERYNKKNHFCTCAQCQNDVVCYVLNNSPPVYIFSGKGATHFKLNYLDNMQNSADLAALIQKGIDRVVMLKRPHFPHDNDQNSYKSRPKGFFFNFPSITGKILNSITFGPVADVYISLNQQGVKMKMINPNWQNPYHIIEKTEGIFTFLPRPVECEKEGIEKDFECELSVFHQDYEPFNHYFSLSLKSEPYFADYYRFEHYYDLKTLYLIPLASLGASS